MRSTSNQSSRDNSLLDRTRSTVSTKRMLYNVEGKSCYQCKEFNIAPLIVHLNWHFKSFTYSTNSNGNGVTPGIIRLNSCLELSSVATLISTLNYNKYTVIIASILMTLI